jgi:ABC-type Na+ efflux pump permease subunit
MLVIAKSPGLYRGRIANSVVLLCMGIAFGLVYHYGGLRAIGPILQMLTFILLTICMFVGVQLTSDSIAREKREGTIGLLFLTHLTPLQIVMGKLIAHGLMGFYWLLIAVPLLSLLLIAGGLEGMQLTFLVLGAMNILFFSCAVGLFVSARNTDRKKAAGYGTWIVLFFWWGMPLLVGLALYLKLPAWVGTALNLFSMGGLYNSPFAGPRVRMINSPWLNMVSIHLLGWAFVWAATVSLRSRWQDRPATAKFSLREWWRNVSLGKPATRVRLRRKLLDRNAFLWLVCRDRLRGMSVWIATIIILAFVFYTAIAAGALLGMVMSFGFGLCILHKMMVATSTAHQLQVEQEQGTLEMLTSTPLRVEEIIHGQILAARRIFWWPAIIVLLTHAGVAGYTVFASEFGPGGGKPAMATLLTIAAVLANGVMYVFDMYVMAWMGMWGAVNVQDARNAAGFAMLRIVVAPALIFGCLTALASLLDWYFGWRFVLPPAAMGALWLLISVVNNFAWLRLVRRELPAEIRIFSLKRYSPDERLSFFGRVGRWLGKLWRGPSKQPPVISSLPGRA